MPAVELDLNSLLHALQHHLEDLGQDHHHAEQLAACLADNFGDSAVRYATNMVHLNLPSDTYAALAEHLAEIGIRVGRPRWVLHRDVSHGDMEVLCRGIQGFSID